MAWADLTAHPATYTVAYWHKPLFSPGGAHGDDPEIKPLWDALYAANADVVINGHDHDYERFVPQDPSGKPDSQRGIREFVAGDRRQELTSHLWHDQAQQRNPSG
jgi:acid phosphatase type 7